MRPVVTEHSFNDKKILLVDSDRYIANIIRSILETFEVNRVSMASSNKEGLNLLEKNNYNCIFIDNMMHDSHGLELIKQIRTSTMEHIRKTPVILCTAFTGLHTVLQARDAGVTEILAKPVSPKQIMQKLDNALFNEREFIISERFLGPDRRRRLREARGHTDRRAPRNGDGAQNEPQGET